MVLKAGAQSSLGVQQFLSHNINVKMTLVINIPAAERSGFRLVLVLTYLKVAQRVNVL